MISDGAPAAGNSLLGQLEQADRKLRRYQSISKDTTGTAQSSDGLIDVTVGLYGDVRELVIDPRVYRSPDASALADALREVINEAVDNAQQTAAGELASLFPNGLDDPSGLAFEPFHAEVRSARLGERS